MTTTVGDAAAKGSAERASHGRAMLAPTGERAGRANRTALGEDARATAPLESHADVGPDDARDPVALLLTQAPSRVPELVPIRHGRMLVSPFTYFRGAALPMAADLAATPVSGLRVQLSGDAHLLNFGAFASPERSLVFDLNDFDETLPGPFEWDVKRLAASFVIAGRDIGFSAKAQRTAAAAAAERYRTAMQDFAGQPVMGVWNARLNVKQDIEQFKSMIKARQLKAAEARLAKARTRDSMQALGKLTTLVDGQRRIISAPPTTVPIEELFSDVQADAIYGLVNTMLARYRHSMQSDRRHLLDQFSVERVARKVVGVGSVGTRAWIVLLTAGDGEEPLFLQVKEAQPSVLASYCGRSEYSNQGERVVAGQRLMQAASDIFLGWTRSRGPADAAERDYYVRQLRDWKFSVPIERMRPLSMTLYARMCGWTLARAHARSGDRVAIAAYLGGSDAFDQAIVDFAEAYADRNERDFAAFREAAEHSRIDAVRGV
ncbi:DUF2252 domain-containing protein [Dactylosporangium sp. McL0621]|uniref:DUF2252 domain-containing protein n=1 Tax=Dactylosporangium sp. McL0621 TaxID=3415678 RepID=UPI003CE9A893